MEAVKLKSAIPSRVFKDLHQNESLQHEVEMEKIKFNTEYCDYRFHVVKF